MESRIYMKVIMVDTEKLKPYKNNPRHNTDAIRFIAKSLEDFGFQQPIVVDSKRVIIVGHTRWEAAKFLGLEKVPVIKADLPPEKAKAYRLADNKTAEKSAWDIDKLITEMADLSDMNYETPMEDYGFAHYEMGDIFGDDTDSGDDTDLENDGDVSDLKSPYIATLKIHFDNIEEVQEAEKIFGMKDMPKSIEWESIKDKFS